MNKKIALIVMAGMLSAGAASAQSNTSYTINGTFPAGNEGDTLLLLERTQMGMFPVDTAYVKDKKFTLKGDVDYVDAQGLMLIKNGEPSNTVEVIIATPGAEINVELSNDPTVKSKFSGDKNNMVWRAIDKSVNSRMEPYQKYIAAINDETLNMMERIQYKKVLDSVVAVCYEDVANQIIANMPLPVCGLLLQTYGGNMNEAQIGRILFEMSKQMPNDPTYQAILSQQKAEAETSEGQPFKELSLLDTKGNLVKLSDVVRNNKYTLIDFWATWCRPCMSEMPNMMMIYDIFHGKGLEIYGVSLDENQIAWQNAIERFKTKWIHVSDLKGWNSVAAKTYNVRAIPMTILIDQSGKIVAKGLRTEDLMTKLKDLLP